MLVVSPIAGLFDRSSPTSNWISLMRGNDRPAGVKQLNWVAKTKSTSQTFLFVCITADFNAYQLNMTELDCFYMML